MRIALRTSGGRGEYELAGKQGQISASDLFEKDHYYEITPQIIIPGRARVKVNRNQGKPRIRLDDQRATTHLYRLLAAVLLLPKPKREFAETHGRSLIERDAYSVMSIKVDVAALQQESVTLRPTDLLLENADNLTGQIDVAERMARVVRLWDHAENSDSPLAELLRRHQDSVMNSSDHKEIEDSADDLSKQLNTTGDPLPLAEQAIGVEPDPQDEMLDIIHPEEATPDFGEYDPLTQSQARIKRVLQWRRIAVRGADGAKFKKNIRAEYRDTCLFTGDRLPKLEMTSSAGVEAAHILPWSTHGINVVNNGICLNKLCHWAFDAGLLKLTFNQAERVYILELPDDYRSAALAEGFTLDYFDRIIGVIPRERLPLNHSEWPNPRYLEELNRFVYGS